MSDRLAATNTTADLVLRALRRTRQVRQFTNEPMTETDLDAILEVARWSGSSMNRQPLTFIVIRDQADLVRLAKLAPNAGHLGEAGLAIAIATRDGQPSASSSPQERSVSGPQSRATG